MKASEAREITNKHLRNIDYIYSLISANASYGETQVVIEKAKYDDLDNCIIKLKEDGYSLLPSNNNYLTIKW